MRKKNIEMVFQLCSNMRKYTRKKQREKSFVNAKGLVTAEKLREKVSVRCKRFESVVLKLKKFKTLSLNNFLTPEFTKKLYRAKILNSDRYMLKTLKR